MPRRPFTHRAAPRGTVAHHTPPSVERGGSRPPFHEVSTTSSGGWSASSSRVPITRRVRLPSGTESPTRMSGTATSIVGGSAGAPLRAQPEKESAHRVSPPVLPGAGWTAGAAYPAGARGGSEAHCPLAGGQCAVDVLPSAVGLVVAPELERAQVMLYRPATNLGALPPSARALRRHGRVSLGLGRGQSPPLTALRPMSGRPWQGVRRCRLGRPRAPRSRHSVGIVRGFDSRRLHSKQERRRGAETHPVQLKACAALRTTANGKWPICGRGSMCR